MEIRKLFNGIFKPEPKNIKVIYLKKNGEIKGYGFTKQNIIRNARELKLSGHLESKYISSSMIIHHQINHKFLN